MPNPRMIWRGEYPIRTDEVNRHGFLTLPSLASYLQDAAAHHACEMGFSVADLQEQGLTWVLSRLHLRIESQASWGNRLQVETWPAGLQGIIVLRDFRVADSANQTIAAGASQWLIMRLDSRRPARPSASLRRLVRQRQAPVLESGGSLEADFEPQGSRRHTVQPCDLDFNQHVNHIRYLEWMLESPELTGTREAEIDFRGEALLGDIVVSRWAVEADTRHHVLVRESDSRLLALAKSQGS